jgi:hypothetical protein
MKKILFLSLLAFALCIYAGCKSPEEKEKELIEAMQAKPVIIPFSKMSCWINDSLITDRPGEKAEMKLVVYTDSNSCSECTLKRLYLWNDFIKLEPKYNGKYSVIFIFQGSSKIKTSTLTPLFHLSELDHPMYIDSTDALMKMNPHIPANSNFHVFLLDKNDNVVLIGNPQFDSTIEDKFNPIITEKIG